MRVLSAALLLLAMLLPGCAGYAIRGQVLYGTAPNVQVVDDSDARLNETGIEGVVVSATIDPDSLNAKHLSAVNTDEKGRFAIPVDEFGAGTLEYQITLVCRQRGYAPVAETLRMPGGGQRILVTMTNGDDRAVKSDDILNETIRMGKELWK